MTENETIEIIKNFPKWNLDDLWLENDKMDELVDMAIKALESRYRRNLLRARSKKLDMSTHIIARPAILVSQALILQNGVTIVVKN